MNTQKIQFKQICTNRFEPIEEVAVAAGCDCKRQTRATQDDGTPSSMVWCTLGRRRRRVPLKRRQNNYQMSNLIPCPLSGTSFVMK